MYHVMVKTFLIQSLILQEYTGCPKQFARIQGTVH